MTTRPRAPIFDARQVLAVTAGAWLGPNPPEPLGAPVVEPVVAAEPAAPSYDPDKPEATALVLATVLQALVHSLPDDVRVGNQRVEWSARLAEAVVRQDGVGMSQALRGLWSAGAPAEVAPPGLHQRQRPAL